MTGPPAQPRFRAMEIGPGGIPAEGVKAVGPEPADATAERGWGATVQPSGLPASESGLPAYGLVAGSAGSIAGGHVGSLPSHQPARESGPSADFGSFDAEPRKPSRKALLALLAMAVAIAVVVAGSLWSDSGQPVDASADLRPGDCLSSQAGQSVLVVDCSSPDVEFTIAARYDDSRDSTRCTAVSSDLVLVTRDDAVLCLNYLARAGECLFAGGANEVGKAPCRTPGSRTPAGLFRVLAVLPSTVDVRGCPAGTISSLVHVTSREVLCLGLP
jgi:hypothetical protein